MRPRGPCMRRRTGWPTRRSREVMAVAYVGAAPLVVKLSVGTAAVPAGKGQGGAAAFAAYIATRAGVAMVAEEPTADPTVHAQYLSERPGSTGLFGEDPAAPPNLAAVQEAIGAAAWWHSWVVSMRGPDAEGAGLVTPQDWRAMVRRAMPQIARTQGMEGMRWVAAVHEKIGKDGVPQPHVHVLVWPADTKAEAMAPRLPHDRLRAAKKVWAHEVFGAQREDMAAQRTARRDQVLRAAEALTHSAAPGDLAQRLADLSGRLPRRGRIALAYMPAAVKAEARAIADWLLGQGAMATGAAEVERLAGALAEQRAGSVEGVAAGKRAMADLRDRVAQVVLRAATRVQPREQEEPETSGEAEYTGWAEQEPPEAEPTGEGDWDFGPEPPEAESTGEGAGDPEPPKAPEVEPAGAGGWNFGPEPPEAEPAGAGLSARAGCPQSHRSREEWQALRAEMRRRDPANALALAAGLPALATAEHAALTATMRRVVVVRREEEGQDGESRLKLDATAGPATDEALAILARLARGSDLQGLRETLAWQCARLQGLRFTDKPMPPTPADALAQKADIELTEEQRAEWTALLRSAAARRDPATGRIEANVAAIQAAVQAAGGKTEEVDAAIQAYRQKEADWREERRGLSDDEALRRCGVVATPADLLAVRLVRDRETQAMRAEGHEALLQALPADADRALAEKEIGRQAAAAQRAADRAKAAAETDPVQALNAMLGLHLSPEEALRLTTLLRRSDVRLDEAGQWPVTSGASFGEAVSLVKSAAPTDSLFDLEGETARTAARVQGLWADQQGDTVAALAEVAGKEPVEVRAALRGLLDGPEAADELARRLGVQPSETLASALGRVPDWLREPAQTPAARLGQRLGLTLTPETEATWAARLRTMEVYRTGAGTVVAGDAAALIAAVEAAGSSKHEGVILQAAWRQDRDALYAARQAAWDAPGRALGPVRQARALAEWAGRGALSRSEEGRWQGLLAEAAQGKPQAEDAMVRMLCMRPEAEARVRAEVREAIAAQRLWQMRPVDALAARLGAEWDAPTRHEVDRLLRRVDYRRGEGVDQVWALAPDATRREVRQAVMREAARAQRKRPVYWGRQAAGLLRGVLAEIERAKAEAEHTTTMEGMTL